MGQRRGIELATLIIGICACIATWLALPQIQRWLDSPSAATPHPTIEITEPPVENTVAPTELVVTEEATEPPLPESDPDTEPGTILEEGQAWRQGGLELRLIGKELHPHLVIVFFSLTNTGNVQRIVEFGQDNFSAVDNLGRRLDTGGVGWNFDPFVEHNCQSDTWIMEPRDSAGFRLCHANWEGVAVGADLTDNSLTEIVVTVSGISSITDARWQIPINH